jgi:predicted PurR-regulated permease PerM
VTSETSPILRRPIAVAAGVIAVYGVMRGLVEVREYIALAFFAVVVAALLTFPIDLFARRLRRGLATLLTLVAFIALAVGVGYLAAPIVIDEATSISQEMPKVVRGITTRLPSGPIAESLKTGVDHALGGLVSLAAPLTVKVVQTATATLLVTALAFFLAASPRTSFRGLSRLVPPDHRPVFREWWHRVGIALRRWTGGAVVSMAVMGTLTGIGLLVLGIRNWLSLAIFTFLGTFVPYLGAVVSAIPALAVALSMSTTKFLLTLVLYLGVHTVEGYVVQPFIMKKAVKIQPAAHLIFQLLMGGVFGIIGIIVAAPALACVQASVEYLYVERHLKPARQ